MSNQKHVAMRFGTTAPSSCELQAFIFVVR